VTKEALEQLDRLRKELAELSKATATLGLSGLSAKLSWGVQMVDHIKSLLKQT
jgi:hypothetical protein